MGAQPTPKGAKGKGRSPAKSSAKTKTKGSPPTPKLAAKASDPEIDELKQLFAAEGGDVTATPSAETVTETSETAVVAASAVVEPPQAQTQAPEPAPAPAADPPEATSSKVAIAPEATTEPLTAEQAEAAVRVQALVRGKQSRSNLLSDIKVSDVKETEGLTVEEMARRRMKTRPLQRCPTCTFWHYSDLGPIDCPRCGSKPVSYGNA